MAGFLLTRCCVPMEKTKWRLLANKIQESLHKILNIFQTLSTKMTSIDENGVIKEGKAEILVEQGANVFYNPVQEFNRDLR